MARPDTPILNRLAEVNHGRSEITGEGSGQGYLGGLGEQPVPNQKSAHAGLPRLPEKDTENSYAFKTGISSHLLILKDKC